MKHADNTEHKMARVYARKKQEMLNDYYSEPKHMDPAAYARFKKMSTDYSTKTRCAYGDHEKRCDAGCLFWNTCIRGRHKNLLKGDDEKLSNALKRKQKSLYYTKQEKKFIQKKEFERSNQEKTIAKAFKEFQCVGYIILHDKFGFGQKRLARLEMTVNTYLNSAADGDKNMSGSAMAYVLKEKYGIDVREEVNKVPQRQLMVLYSQKGKVVQSAAYKIASASMFNYLALTMMALKTILKMSVNQLHEFVDKFIDYIDTLSNFSQYALTVPMIADSLAEEINFKCDLERR